MKLQLLCVFLLIFVLVVQVDGDAGWRRRRRRRRWIKPILKWVCHNVCRGYHCRWLKVHCVLKKICHHACKKVCRKIGKKRDEAEDPVITDVHDGSFTLKHPSQLAVYDTNKDGRISQDEFRVVPAHPDDSQTDEDSFQAAFDSLDKDSDGFLSCDEFLNANLDFDDVKQTC